MGDLPQNAYVGKLLFNIVKLLPCDGDDLKRYWGFEEELNQLRNSLVSMADLVEFAEDEQLSWVAVRQWLWNLKEVAYEANDLLSELAYETAQFRTQHKEVQIFSSISRAIDNMVRKAKFRRRMAHRLEKLKQSLEKIQRDSQYLRLTSVQRGGEEIMFQNFWLTDSQNDSPIIGRKADITKVFKMVTSSCNQNLTVVSIVGTGGLGKTVLAKLVCQRVMALERNPFDVTIWMRAPDNISTLEILQQMLIYLNTSVGDFTNEDALVQQLKQELASKKFLLLLDDFWCSFSTSWQWSDLKSQISKACSNTGNVLLVTTRSEVVANTSSAIQYRGETSEHVHKLGLLSDDECWSILKGRAFPNMTQTVPSNLEAIGSEIAKKCRGLPLVAKVLGGIMGFHRDEQTWMRIKDNNVLRAGLRKDSLEYILIQCFHLLPSSIKPCFVFCSIFPKGFLIRKEELIWLWMAEHIVESYGMGDKIFDVLLAISFFQDAEKDNDDNVILCKMHDIVHDLALYVSRYQVSVESYAGMDVSMIDGYNPRTGVKFPIYHFYADDELVLPSIDIPKDRSKKMRTIIIHGAFDQNIMQMQWLHSLDLNGVDMKVFQSSFGRMKHLRYLKVSNLDELARSIAKLYNLQALNLSKSLIKEFPKFIVGLHNLCSLNLSSSVVKRIPESICKLHKLQTLDVSNSPIEELPDSISELCSLHTLKFLKCKELTKLPKKKLKDMTSLTKIAFSYEHQMPFGLGKLTGLETLSFFVVGLERGGSIRELEFLNELRGDMEITRLEEVGHKEVESADLQRKLKIQGLSFVWGCEANGRSSRDEEVLQGLQPHSNLKRLKIKCYMGENWPSWMLRTKSPSDNDSFRAMHNLVDLRLEQCSNSLQLPCLGDLRHLRVLKMSHLRKVKCVDNKFYGIDGSIEHSNLTLFPALKSLSMTWMESLTDWYSPSVDQRVVLFPCLENLSIQYCPKLTGFPVSNLSELEKVEIRNSDELWPVTNKQQSFRFLASLSVAGCSKFTDLQDWISSDNCFKELSVQRCQWLTFIPKGLEKLSHLTSLEIYCCKRLTFFADEILSKITQLQNLSIGAFSEELDDFCYLNQIKELPCLEELEIWGSDFFGREMSFLPDQIQHVTALKSLKLMGFSRMEALPEWLMNLQSLGNVSLDHCKILECQSTATIIQRLPNLMYLGVNCCPVLEDSKQELLQYLDTTEVKVRFSPVSQVKARLGY